MNNKPVKSTQNSKKHNMMHWYILYVPQSRYIRTRYLEMQENVPDHDKLGGVEAIKNSGHSTMNSKTVISRNKGRRKKKPIRIWGSRRGRGGIRNEWFEDPSGLLPLITIYTHHFFIMHQTSKSTGYRTPNDTKKK